MFTTDDDYSKCFLISGDLVVVADAYIKGPMLGQGGFGSVFAGTRSSDGLPVKHFLSSLIHSNSPHSGHLWHKPYFICTEHEVIVIISRCNVLWFIWLQVAIKYVTKDEGHEDMEVVSSVTCKV